MDKPCTAEMFIVIGVVANAIRVNVVQVWLSPFFHWKKGCELFATANARDDDSSNAADKINFYIPPTKKVAPATFPVLIYL